MMRLVDDLDATVMKQKAACAAVVDPIRRDIQ
jgi:hypothetical protein